MTVATAQVTQTLFVVSGQTIYNTVIDLTQDADGIPNLPFLRVDKVTLTGIRTPLINGTDYTAVSITNATRVTFYTSLVGSYSLIFYRHVPNTQNINFVTPVGDTKFKQNITNSVDKLTSEAQDAQGEIELLKFNNNNIASGFQAALDLKADIVYVDEQVALLVPLILLAQPNGVATLDSAGKVPFSQLPPSLAAPILGYWDANTNLTTTNISLVSSVGTEGDKWEVDVAGGTVLNGAGAWQVGDQVVFSAGSWIPLRNVKNILSVNGLTGVVNLTADNIPAGVLNHYYSSSAAQTDALVVFNDNIGPIEASIADKVDIDVITTNGTFGAANRIPILTTNAQGLVTGLSDILVSITSSEVTDFGDQVNFLTSGKANKVAPSVGNTIARLTAVTGDLNDSGIIISTDQTLANAFNTTVPTGTAVKTYFDTQNALDEKITNKGVANGYAPLGPDKKVPLEFLDNTTFAGGWDASTNTPTLTAGTGVNGTYYTITASGSQTSPSGEPTVYLVGGEITYSTIEGIWVYTNPSAPVSSVNTKIGAVVLGTGDLEETTDPNTLQANLFYQDGRVATYMQSPAAAATTVQQGTVTTTATGQVLAASTAFSTYAPLVSPAFSGMPTAPTAPSNSGTTRIATCAYVDASRDIPVVFAARGSSSPIPAGGTPNAVKIIFPIEDIDTQTNYLNGRFTATIPGNYCFKAFINGARSVETADIGIQLRVNDVALLATFQSFSPPSYNMSLDYPVVLAIGDYIEFWAINNAVSNNASIIRGAMSGFLI